MAGLKDVYANWKAKRAGKNGGAPSGASNARGHEDPEGFHLEDELDADELGEEHSHVQEDEGLTEPAQTSKGGIALKGNTSNVRKVPVVWLLVLAVVAGLIFVVVTQLKLRSHNADKKPVTNAMVQAPVADKHANTVRQDADTSWLDAAKGALPSAAPKIDAAPAPPPDAGLGGKRPTIDLGTPLVPGITEGKQGPTGAPSFPAEGKSNGNGGSAGAPAVAWTMDDVRHRNFAKDPAYMGERIAQDKASLKSTAVVYKAPRGGAQSANNANLAAPSLLPAGMTNKNSGFNGNQANGNGAGSNGAQQQVSGVPGGDQYIQSLPAAPITKYLVKAGTTIPVILRNALNSDLPGAAYGQVTRNIYDSATGRYLLIPQGSTVSGPYGANTVYGQERLLIAWTRVDFPDGTYENLRGQPSADFAGIAGIAAEVDNHYFRTLGNAFMMSIVGAVSSSIVDKATGSQASSGNANSSPTVAQQMSLGMANYFSQVSMQIISKGMNTKPTLMIQQGERMNVILTGDLILKGTYNP